MTSVTELWVNRENFRDTKIVTQESTPLLDGQIRVAIDKFGLTANNVSYALSGDQIGYWRFFPAEEVGARYQHGVSQRSPSHAATR